MSMTKHFAIMGAAMLALKRIDQEDPEVLMYTRLVFAGYVLVSVIINVALYLRVLAARDLGIITVPAPPPSPFAPPAPAVTDGANPGTPVDEDAKDTQSTVLAYDLNLLQTARKSWLMNAVILTLVHMKTASVSPLLMSTIMGLTRYLDDPLFKLHILGFQSEGPLKRPFPVDKNPLAGLLQGILPEAPSMAPAASGSSSTSHGDVNRRTQQFPPAYVEDLHEDEDDEDDNDDEHAPVSLIEQDDPNDNDFDSDGPADEPKKSK
jgi:hypothetical protein